MRNQLLGTLAAILTLVSRLCLADCDGRHDEGHFIACPKTYVQTQQIAFFDDAIFVQINDLVLQTDAIHSDGEGVYFQNVKMIKCGNNEWLCTKEIRPGCPCNTCNPNWYSWCTACGKWR